MKVSSKVTRAQNTSETISKRYDYVLKLLSLENQGCRFVYLDEFGCDLHTRRMYARSRVGTVANIDLPAVCGGNASTCAAIDMKRVVC